MTPDATHPTENPSRLEQEGIQAISDFTEVVEELNSSKDLTSYEYKRLLDAGMRMYRATPTRIAEQANQHSRAAYQQGVRDGYRRERAAMTSFLQAEPGRRVLYFSDGAIRGAIKRDKRHKKTEKTETLIAVAAAVASMAVLGLV